MNAVRNHDDYRPLTKLLAKIGQEAGASFCISLIPGMAGMLAAALNSVSGIFGSLLKFRNNGVDFFINLLYSGSSALSRKELRRIELEQVRCAKRSKDYEKALSLVCGILETDAECAEALLLNATILHEGFDNPAGARSCLRKLLRLNPAADNTDNNNWHRWGAALYAELAPNENSADTSEQVRTFYE